MCAMNVFLKTLDMPEVTAQYAVASQTWSHRQALMNERLQAAGVPVRVAGMETVWSVLYELPSRYNWLLQYYLRAQGIALSWVGTGRMIFSFNFDDAAYDDFCQRFVQAAQHMQTDGWWWVPEAQTGKKIRRQILKEMLAARFRGA
jgi:glutamate-1-semialdehyde 2,1-aminomutase